MRASVVSSVGLLALLVVTAALCGPGEAVAPSHADEPDACCGVMYCSVAALTAGGVDTRQSPEPFQAGAIAVPESTSRPPVLPPPESLAVSVTSLVG